MSDHLPAREDTLGLRSGLLGGRDHGSIFPTTGRPRNAAAKGLDFASWSLSDDCVVLGVVADESPGVESGGVNGPGW